MSRKFIAAANWKMNKAPEEVKPFFKELAGHLKSPGADHVVIFPPALLASEVQKNLPPLFQWGGQNCHFENSGAFTGENSPQTLKALGAHWVLVGHSERRTLFGETNEVIAKKVAAAQKAGLSPMLCVGENLAERDAGQTNSVIEKQIREGLKLADFSKELAVAYEPVWAIGTGRVASVEQVREAHGFLQKLLANLAPENSISILYGGSVTPQNCQDLAKVPGVDGFLVGGASLKPESFAVIASTHRV